MFYLAQFSFSAPKNGAKNRKNPKNPKNPKKKIAFFFSKLSDSKKLKLSKCGEHVTISYGTAVPLYKILICMWGGMHIGMRMAEER